MQNRLCLDGMSKTTDLLGMLAHRGYSASSRDERSTWPSMARRLSPELKSIGRPQLSQVVARAVRSQARRRSE
jgi:hypothetical protein